MSQNPPQTFPQKPDGSEAVAADTAGSEQTHAQQSAFSPAVSGEELPLACAAVDPCSKGHAYMLTQSLTPVAEKSLLVQLGQVALPSVLAMLTAFFVVWLSHRATRRRDAENTERQRKTALSSEMKKRRIDAIEKTAAGVFAVWEKLDHMTESAKSGEVPPAHINSILPQTSLLILYFETEFEDAIDKLHECHTECIELIKAIAVDVQFLKNDANSAGTHIDYRQQLAKHEAKLEHEAGIFAHDFGALMHKLVSKRSALEEITFMT